MAKKKNGGGETITQLEAVRQALASGAESAEKAVNFIKNKFGISLKPPSVLHVQVATEEQGEHDEIIGEPAGNETNWWGNKGR